MDVSTSSVGKTSIGYHRDYAAGESRAVSTHVADFDVDPYTHDVCLLDSTSTGVDATLPDVTTVPVGRAYTFIAINIDSTTTLVSADNIDGSGSFTFTAVNQAVIVISDGSTWYTGNHPAAIADGTITPAKTERERVLLADTNGTVVAADKVIYISTTGAGSRTLTFGDTGVAGHRVLVVMTAFSTGTYATSGIDSGEVTFNAAGMQVEFVYNETADTWQALDTTIAEVAANSVDSDAYVDGSIDLIHMSANSVDSDQYVDGSIDTVHIGDAQVTPIKLSSGYRVIAEDGALALADTDRTIELTNVTAAGDVTITTASANPGQQVWIKLVAADANGYELAVTGGTLTFNAADESALIVRNDDDDAWVVFALFGATIV